MRLQGYAWQLGGIRYLQLGDVSTGHYLTQPLSLCSDEQSENVLTLVLLNPDIPCFANSVDPDQLASEEAN